MILYATGFKLSFPFIDAGGTSYYRGGRPELYLNIFHPDATICSARADPTRQRPVGIGGLPAKLIANYVLSQQQNPAQVAWFAALKRSPGTGAARERISTPRGTAWKWSIFPIGRNCNA